MLMLGPAFGVAFQGQRCLHGVLKVKQEFSDGSGPGWEAPGQKDKPEQDQTGGHRLGQACGVEGRALRGWREPRSLEHRPRQGAGPRSGEGGVEAQSRLWESSAWETRERSRRWSATQHEDGSLLPLLPPGPPPRGKAQPQGQPIPSQADHRPRPEGPASAQSGNWSQAATAGPTRVSPRGHRLCSQAPIPVVPRLHPTPKTHCSRCGQRRLCRDHLLRNLTYPSPPGPAQLLTLPPLRLPAFLGSVSLQEHALQTAGGPGRHL